MSEVETSLPVLEDPGNYAYIRPEAGGLMIGLFEGAGQSWSPQKVAKDFSFGEIPADWERMAPYLEKAMSRVPSSLNVGMKHLFCGPESFTPDLAPLIGESSELDGYFVAAGMNSVGILTGGGVGRCIADWIVLGRPTDDVSAVRVDRFKPFQGNLKYRSERAGESLGKVYETHYPNSQYESSRMGMVSPINERLKLLNPHYRDVSGYESPDYYRLLEPAICGSEQPTLTYPKSQLSFSRGPEWDHWKREHEATRNNVALFDMSFMTKFLVQGNDAGHVLELCSTALVDGPVGETVYTQWLREDGLMAADLTITKLDDTKFMVVVTDTMHNTAQAHVRRAATRYGKQVVVTDVTGSMAQINLHGPNSRQLLQQLTDANLSNDAFPFRKAQTIEIGLARVLCVRITYVGELGFELYIPAEQSLHVYDQIVAAGRNMGLVHAGLRALGSCRMEKAYRDFGHDMDNTDNLIEVGLAFTAKNAAKKAVRFIGQDAFEAQKNRLGRQATPRRLLQVLCKNPEPLLTHGEIVLRNGAIVGDIRSASYGFTLNGAVGLSMIESVDVAPVNKAYVDSGTWELDIAGKRYPAAVSIAPMYDANNERVK